MSPSLVIRSIPTTTESFGPDVIFAVDAVVANCCDAGVRREEGRLYKMVKEDEGPGPYFDVESDRVLQQCYQCFYRTSHPPRFSRQTQEQTVFCCVQIAF